MTPFRRILAVAAISLLAAGGAYAFGGPGAKGYVGSDQCEQCHDEIYNQWILTPHANMLRDAKKNRAAVAAVDYSRVPFKKKDIYWTIGAHWVQKYLTYIDNDWFVLPKTWNLVNGDWEGYSNFLWKEKPYTIWCDGCHTTGFDGETKTFHEPSIGCEACHGPAEKHVAEGGGTGNIVNPLKLSKDRREQVCEQCHTDGKDTKYGGQYPFPAGYTPGENIDDYFTNFFMPKPKSNKWYWGSMDYKERHRMFMFWKSKMYSTARACEVCGFDRGAAKTQKAERYMSRDEYCGTCHGKILKISSIHSRHEPEKVQCVDCHNPATVDNGTRYSIHDHKFDFSAPAMECTECHEYEDVQKKEDPGHNFHIVPVRQPVALTLEEACAKCHPDKDIAATLTQWKQGGGAAE